MTTTEWNRCTVKPRGNRPAFTLVELLVVVSILSVLIALLMPTVNKAQELARRSVCMNNLGQMMMASLNYSSDYRGWMPDSPRVAGIQPKNRNDGSRNLQHSATGPEVIGKTISGNYLPEAKPGIVYCPSRNPNIRYGINSKSWGWANWANGGTVEYSYQHRTKRQLSDANPDDVYGADLGIVDNYRDGAIIYWSVSVGADICHKDQYYNVSYYDQSVRPFIDRDEILENPAIYYNYPGRVLNTIEQLKD